LASALSKIASRFGRWRLAFLVFLVVYAVLMLLYLDYAPVRWDETPHLYGGLLLSRGQFDDFLRENAFYPPLFDVTTALFFKVMGVSLLSARLVAVTFGLLSLWIVFEYAKKLYGPRTALLSSVLLGSMPGFVTLCKMALIETMLMFFFSISLFLFFSWMRTKKDRLLILTGITLGLGFLVKYQMVIGGIIILISLLYFIKQRLAIKLSKFLLILIVALVVISPWVFVTYQQYASEMLGKWFYVAGMGNEERLAYSTRFPTPIFYLIEMTQPYPHRHPIALPLYLFSLAGLGLWMWRRNEGDKFSLITFATVYVVFTIITSKDWRYITLVFPILAVSASEMILFLWDKARSRMKAPNINLRKKNIAKVAAAALVVLVSVSVAYSAWEAYLWVEFDHVNIPIDEASKYVAEHVTADENIMILCAGNYFSADMVEFYLLASDPNQEQPMQYPELPVDAYKPSFNYTDLIELCKKDTVKYLMLFELGNITFYDSDLRYQDVLDDMLATNRFTIEKEFGTFPRQIYVLRFLSKTLE
jgi:4-amino-4-deoxy-L-arabinose transferase-like glycosyltransferase